LIVIDKIDLICKKPGAGIGSAGVADTIMNQLLPMIDGVDAFNCVLLIGMTNFGDLMDEATRPDWLEVIIEILFPNKAGRQAPDLRDSHTPVG
jgi:SpoVK/Ycf46/Vps4 family AAA+-type ATPase